MHKILVTGATGFIGSNLVKVLRDKKYKVIAAIRSEKKKQLLPKNVGYIALDLMDKDGLSKAVSVVDTVFNVAATLPYHQLRDQDYINSNVLGVSNIIDACLNYNAKLVHISTVGVFGDTSVAGYDETAPIKTTDIYSRTKREGDLLIYKAIRDKKLKATIIRPTIGYGPGDIRPGFINLFRLIKRGLFIPVGKGENFFHTIYIENLIAALILAGSKKEALGEDFIIGDDPCPRMSELINIIAAEEGVKLPSFYIPGNLAYTIGLVGNLAKKVGFSLPLTTQRVKFITQNKRFKIERAKKVLGYSPQFDLRAGVAKTYAWYTKNKYIT